MPLEPVIKTCHLGIEDEEGNFCNSSFDCSTSCANTKDTKVNIDFAFNFCLDLSQEPNDGTEVEMLLGHKVSVAGKGVSLCL